MNVAREFDWQFCYPDGICLRGALLDDSTRGEGDAGIYIHGFRSDAAGTKAMALARHAAAQGRSWLRFDLRGHGRSDGAFGDFSISAMLADVEAVITQLRAQRRGKFYLVGSSMGAWLAVLAALRHPDRLKGLLLLAPGFNFIQRHFDTLSAADRMAWQRRGSFPFMDRYGGNSYSLAYAAVEDARKYDVLASPVALACAVTIVHGERDELVPMAPVQRFFDALSAPAKRLVGVPQGDHRLSGFEPLICAELDRMWQT